MGYFKFASRTAVILLSLALFVVMTAGFVVLAKMIGIPHVLDLATTEDAARSLLGLMDDDAKQKHFLTTLTLDTAYPLVIMTFLGGVIYRFAPRSLAGFLCLFPIAAALIDFGENTTIMLILKGMEDLLPLKTQLTQLKGPAFLIAEVIALLCLLYGIVKKVFSRS